MRAGTHSLTHTFANLQAALPSLPVQALSFLVPSSSPPHCLGGQVLAGMDGNEKGNLGGPPSDRLGAEKWAERA